jgi:hypothetical protein
MEAARNNWSAESRADKEFGGKDLDANLGTAKRALDRFGSPDLKRFLDETGLGNHKDVIRFFWKVGKAISEDGFVGDSGRPGKRDGPLTFAEIAERMYPNQTGS